MRVCVCVCVCVLVCRAIPGLPSDSRWMMGYATNRYPPFQEKEGATDVSFKSKLYSTSEYLLYDLEKVSSSEHTAG